MIRAIPLPLILILPSRCAERKGALDNTQEDDDGFDVAVEDAISDHPAKRTKGAGPSGKKIPRQARDQKFGFGGPRKRSKQNTKSSTDSFDAGSAGRGKPRGGKSAKGPAKRPGKSRRVAARSRS